MRCPLILDQAVGGQHDVAGLRAGVVGNAQGALVDEVRADRWVRGEVTISGWPGSIRRKLGIEMPINIRRLGGAVSITRRLESGASPIWRSGIEAVIARTQGDEVMVTRGPGAEVINIWRPRGEVMVVRVPRAQGSLMWRPWYRQKNLWRLGCGLVLV